MIDRVPPEILDLIRDGELLLAADRREREERRLEELRKQQEEDERVQEVLLAALPKELRDYVVFPAGRYLRDKDLQEFEQVLEIRILGLFPIQAYLKRQISKTDWEVCVYQVSIWSPNVQAPAYADKNGENDFRKALLLAKQRADEARNNGWIEGE